MNSLSIYVNAGNQPKRKFHYLLMVVAFICLGVGIGLIGHKFGYASQIIILAAILGAPFALWAFFDLRFGSVVVIILSFFILGIKRIIGDVPLGLLLDSLIALMVLSMVVQLVRKRDWAFANNQISLAVLIWVIYNMLEAINPWAASVQAWCIP